jgi:hypothetical protein
MIWPGLMSLVMKIGFSFLRGGSSSRRFDPSFVMRGSIDHAFSSAGDPARQRSLS